MIKRDTIKSLAQLRQRKQELKQEMELTQREMKQSLGIMRGDLQTHLLKKYALPAGGVALGLYLFKKFVLDPTRAESAPPQAGAAESAPPPVYAAPGGRSSESLDLSQIIKIAIPIVKVVMNLLAKQQQQDEEAIF
jgi:hypothetical protein